MQKTGFKNVDNCDPRMCINSKISRSQRIISGIFRKHLKDFGITSSQLSMLFVLSKKGSTSQQELADILYLEKSSVSRNKLRMLKEGLLEKQGLNLNISKAGLTLLNQVIPCWDKAMKEAKTKLASEGLKALDSVVNQLIKK